MAWRELPDQDRLDVMAELRRLVERVADQVTTGATPVRPYDGPPEQQTAGQLALIHAATLLRTMVDDLADQAARDAGRLGLVTFPQLGEAAGITRQSARERWRHLIPEQHLRPGRRRRPVPPAAAPEPTPTAEQKPVGQRSADLDSPPANEMSTARTAPRAAPPPEVPEPVEVSRERLDAPVAEASGQDSSMWERYGDPFNRRRWYSEQEAADITFVKSGAVDGSQWVVIAGDILGSVRPHLSARGTRSGWEAIHRSGTAVFHMSGKGRGRHPGTRERAVAELLADVHLRWQENRRHAERSPSPRKEGRGVGGKADDLETDRILVALADRFLGRNIEVQQAFLREQSPQLRDQYWDDVIEARRRLQEHMDKTKK